MEEFILQQRSVSGEGVDLPEENSFNLFNCLHLAMYVCNANCKSNNYQAGDGSRIRIEIEGETDRNTVNLIFDLRPGWFYTDWGFFC